MYCGTELGHLSEPLVDYDWDHREQGRLSYMLVKDHSLILVKEATKQEGPGKPFELSEGRALNDLRSFQHKTDSFCSIVWGVHKIFIWKGHNKYWPIFVLAVCPF